jgi:hypothetical protein
MPSPPTSNEGNRIRAAALFEHHHIDSRPQAYCPRTVGFAPSRGERRSLNTRRNNGSAAPSSFLNQESPRYSKWAQ